MNAPCAPGGQLLTEPHKSLILEVLRALLIILFVVVGLIIFPLSWWLNRKESDL